METKRDLYIAKTFAGLEPLLEKELSEVGAEEITVLRRAVSFTGDKQVLYRANIWCRTALSILKQIHSFSFEDKDGFYEQMHQFDWPELFDKDKTFTIIPVSYNNEVFNNTMYLAQLSKDAIADCFTDKYGSRPDIDNANANIRINVHVQNEQCSISLDSSGEALFKRGYRIAAGPAPINEILAAGLIMLSAWDKTSPFIDPMCGSGTFSIEAAMMSANMAPAAERKSFGFSHWPDFDPALLKQEQEDAKSKQTQVKADIIASDNMGFMLDHARRNVMNAGLMGSIKIQKNDFFTYRPPYEKGWLIINPPYGKRMQYNEIDKLHEDIGEALKHRYTGFRAGIITSEIAAMRHIGLKPSFKTQVYNGPLQCVFNVYDLFAGKRKEKFEGGEARSPKPDTGYKRTDNRDWKKDDREQRTGDRKWKTEGGEARSPRPDTGYKRTDNRDWKKDDREQRTGDRKWKSEGGEAQSPKPDTGYKRTDNREWKKDDREQRTGDRKWKSEGGEARSSRPGAGFKRTDNREWKKDDREQRAGDRQWKSEGGDARSSRPGAGFKRTDNREWKKDDREQRTGDRKWQSEGGDARSSRPGAGYKRTDSREWKKDDRGRRTGDRERKPDSRGPRSEFKGRRTSDRRKPGDGRTGAGRHKPRE